MRLAGVVALVLLVSPRGLRAAAPGTYSPEQVKATAERYVERRSAEGGGVFRMVDDRTGRDLALEYVHVGVVAPAKLWGVHDPSGKQTGAGYAACVRFHPVGAPAESVYDVDLSIEPRGDALAVTGVRVHKQTLLENGRWVWTERAPEARAP
jgi:hypothetical protein